MWSRISSLVLAIAMGAITFAQSNVSDRSDRKVDPNESAYVIVTRTKGKADVLTYSGQDTHERSLYESNYDSIVIYSGGHPHQVVSRGHRSLGDTYRRVVPDGQRLLFKGGHWVADTYDQEAFDRFKAAKDGQKWYGICGGYGCLPGMPLVPQVYTQRVKIVIH